MNTSIVMTAANINYRNKYSRKVKLAEGLKINAPILSDYPVNIECKVVDSIITGSHEMFAGKIEFFRTDEKPVDSGSSIYFAAIALLALKQALFTFTLQVLLNLQSFRLYRGSK